MKNRATLCFSIFKENKGFSLGLLMLFFFGATLMVMCSFLPATVNKSLDMFITDYNMSQGSIVTELMPTDVDGFDTAIDGINKIESQMVVDTTVKITDEILKQMRIFTIEDDGFRKYHVFDKIDVPDSEKSIWVTKYLADAVGLHAGDYLEVKFPSGYENIKIAQIVSTPESSSCCYDDTYWAEDYDFGNLFMSRKNFEDVFGVSGMSNTRSFMFDENLPLEKKDEAIDKAASILGDSVISTDVFERSKAKTIIDANKQSLSQACDMFPYIIFIVLVICSVLFLYQIVNYQRKKIGLLRALGYRAKQIIRLYLTYVFIIALIAVISGSVVAYALGNMVIGEYQSIFSIPKIYYTVPIKTYILLAVLFFAGSFSCYISARRITKIDPSEAYSAGPATSHGDKSRSQILKSTSVFNKIAISKILRNKKRLFLFSFSLAACVTLSFVAISCLHSKGASNESTFSSRLNYDMLLYLDDENIIDEVNNLDEVAICEPSTIFCDRLYLDGKDLNLQYNAIKEDSQLVVPTGRSGERLYSQDGIVMEEYIYDYFNLKSDSRINVKDQSLRVDKIAREYVNFVQYISFETADKLGYSKPNAAFIKLINPQDEDKVFKKISEMNGYKYMKFLDHQRAVKLSNQRALDLVYYAIVFLAMLIGMIIIVNMVAISISERKLEYATLLALGTDIPKFRSMIIIENIIQYVIAVIISAVPSYFLAQVILVSMGSPQLNFPFIDVPNIYIEAFALALLYVIVGVAYTIIKIKKLNSAVILNSRE